MLAERLNEVTLDLHSHANHRSLVSDLEKVLAHVRKLRQTQKPGGDMSPEAVRNQLEHQLGELFTSLGADPSNTYPPSQIRILKEIDGWEVTGTRLKERVEEIFDAPALEGAQVEAELADLLKETKTFYEGLATLLSGFRSLGVGRSTIPGGDNAEVGISYPKARRDGKLHLEDLHSELGEWVMHLRFFAEVGGVTPGKAHLKAIGSSGWEFFLETPLR